jgi:hypothetical protein
MWGMDKNLSVSMIFQLINRENKVSPFKTHNDSAINRNFNCNPSQVVIKMSFLDQYEQFTKYFYHTDVILSHRRDTELLFQ